MIFIRYHKNIGGEIHSKLYAAITKNPTLDPFVKDILLFENDEIKTENKLHFYADGFGGIKPKILVYPIHLNNQFYTNHIEIQIYNK